MKKVLLSFVLLMVLCSFVMSQATSTTETQFVIGTDATSGDGIRDVGGYDDEDGSFTFVQWMLIGLLVCLILYLLMKNAKKKKQRLASSTATKPTRKKKSRRKKK